MATKKIYEFYVELRESNPKIWRVFQIDQQSSVAEMVYILQTLFEMKASHLFKVTVPKGQMQVEAFQRLLGDEFDEESFLEEHPDLPSIRYIFDLLDIIDPMFVSSLENDLVFNVTKEKIKQAISKVGERLEVWYDFGDSWYLDVTLKTIITTEKDVFLPKVISGEGFGIIEDCGGVDGLSDIIKAFKHKRSQAYKEYADWLGMKDFDFSKFNLLEMNERLQVIPDIYKRSYEKKKGPTIEEIDYIERKYENKKDKT